MPDNFTITKEEQKLIESLRKNGVVIDHRTGTAYVGKDERLFTASEVMAMLDEAELLARTMGALFLDVDEARAMASADIATIKVRHGVSLDPA